MSNLETPQYDAKSAELLLDLLLTDSDGNLQIINSTSSNADGSGFELRTQSYEQHLDGVRTVIKISIEEEFVN